VKLRVEHQHLFYVWQVLFPALLMILTSVTPLAMPPREDDMGDRLAVYGGGLLTLVAFKYGVADHLPSVPYATFVDTYLKWQVICVSVCALESVVSFHLILRGHDHDINSDDVFWNLDETENLMFWLLVVGWCLYFIRLGFIMPLRKLDWRDVWDRSAKMMSYFESTQMENDRQPLSFPEGAKFIVLRDGLAVWDVTEGQIIDDLAVRMVVQANGKVFSSAAEGRRIYSKDDQLYTQKEFIQQHGEEGWNTECSIAMMMPLRKDDRDYGAVVVYRTSAQKDAERELPYDRWENVRLLEKHTVVDHKASSGYACAGNWCTSLRQRFCKCSCCSCHECSTKVEI
jgi:hypothetical protein